MVTWVLRRLGNSDKQDLFIDPQKASSNPSEARGLHPTGLMEVDPDTSQPGSCLLTGYLLGQDHSARLPGGQALGWTSEGSSEDQNQGADMDFGYLGISTDLISCNNPSRYPLLLVTHGTWPIKAP